MLHTDGKDFRFSVCGGMPCLLHTARQNSRFPVCAGTPVHVEYIGMLLFHKMIQLTKQSTMESLGSSNNLVNCLSFSSDTEESDIRFLSLPDLAGTSGASNGRQPLNTRKKIVNSTKGDKKSTDVRSQFPETWLWDLYIIG